MSKLTCTGNVQGSEHSVLIHGTKLLPDLEHVCGVNEVLYSVKHVNVNELNELVETIVRVNSKRSR